jgi:hypothetical protein
LCGARHDKELPKKRASNANISDSPNSLACPTIR